MYCAVSDGGGSQTSAKHIWLDTCTNCILFLTWHKTAHQQSGCIATSRHARNDPHVLQIHICKESAIIITTSKSPIYDIKPLPFL